MELNDHIQQARPLRYPFWSHRPLEHRWLNGAVGAKRYAPLALAVCTDCAQALRCWAKRPREGHLGTKLVNFRLGEMDLLKIHRAFGD